MKCPKCDYLSFEPSDRCRNCGYDFSFSSHAPVQDVDWPIDQGTAEPLIPSPDAAAAEPRSRLDLDRVIGGPAEDLPLFGEPLITTPSAPRAPLSVRRTTPEIPRARITTGPRSAELFEDPPAAVLGHRAGAARAAAVRGQTGGGETPAPVPIRIVAAAIDSVILLALDSLVLYFTLRLLGLTTGELPDLPRIPLFAFLVLLNGGYFVAFTAFGGQSIGKMAVGIKVIDQEEGSVPVTRAALRTVACLISALPLGAGFLPAVIGADGLALHDRLAHTRVVRPSSP